MVAGGVLLVGFVLVIGGWGVLADSQNQNKPFGVLFLFVGVILFLSGLGIGMT